MDFVDVYVYVYVCMFMGICISHNSLMKNNLFGIKQKTKKNKKNKTKNHAFLRT